MKFIKHAQKTNYSDIEVYERRNKIYKKARFDFEHINFGNYQSVISNLNTKRKKYLFLLKIYRNLVHLNFYPPKTEFHVAGYDNPKLLVIMQKLPHEAKELPHEKIRKVEHFLFEKNKLFQDVYSVHNYFDLDNQTYFVDLEIFPKN